MAVHHGGIHRRFDVPGLTAGELTVEEEHIRFQGLYALGDLLQPTGAHHRGGIRGRALLYASGHHLHAGGVGQLGQFVQRAVDVIFPGVHCDQDGSRAFFGIFKHGFLQLFRFGWEVAGTSGPYENYCITPGRLPQTKSGSLGMESRFSAVLWCIVIEEGLTIPNRPGHRLSDKISGLAAECGVAVTSWVRFYYTRSCPRCCYRGV